MSEIVKSEFQIMDEADSTQIQEAETAVKQALAYEVRGKKQLSYMGIKWIVLKMSQKEQPLEVVDMPIVELTKHDPDNKNSWVWYATIKVRNRKTGLSTIGASESPFNFNGQYDSFGRTKAISKAERNAFRKQIPELEINAMLDTISPNDIQPLQSQNNSTQSSDAPSQKQLDYLNSLGYTGPKPDTKQIASNIIEDLKNGAKEAETVTKDDDGYKKYCTCEKSIPNSINGKTCQNCKKLLKDES